MKVHVIAQMQKEITLYGGVHRTIVYKPECERERIVCARARARLSETAGHHNACGQGGGSPGSLSRLHISQPKMGTGALSCGERIMHDDEAVAGAAIAGASLSLRGATAGGGETVGAPFWRWHAYISQGAMLCTNPAADNSVSTACASPNDICTVSMTTSTHDVQSTFLVDHAKQT